MASANSTKSQKRKFTNPRQLDTLKPEPNMYEARDEGAPGLRVRVYPSGKKVFCWRYKHPGISKWSIKTLGAYPELGLSDARKNLDQLKERHQQMIESGEAESEIKTVSDLADAFFESIKKRRKWPEDVERFLRIDIHPKIGKYKLDSIRTPTIGKMVADVASGTGNDKRKGPTPAQAKKVLAVAKQMFAFGEAMGYIDRNPAHSLKDEDLGCSENARDRYLTSDEIRTFWKLLDDAKGYGEQTLIGYKLLLLTGVRTGELLKARWDDVDLKAAEWTIPVENQKLTLKQAKKAKPFVVPLAPLVVRLFAQLKDFSMGSPYVMASDLGASGRYDDKVLGRALRRMFEKEVDGKPIMTIDKFVPHDLRRTLRTHLSETLNVQPHIAEKCLNHSLGRIESVYNQAELLGQRREAMDRWADFIDRLVNEKCKIIEIDARA